MFDVRELNIAIELWGAVFCVIGIACTLLFTYTQRDFRVHLATLFGLVLCATTGDAIAGIFRGQPGTLASVATHVGNYVTFSGNFMLLAAYTSYLCRRIEGAGANSPQTWRTTIWICSTCMCLLTAMGLFYRIDSANLYHRTGFFWLTVAYVLPVGLIDTIITLRHREVLGRSLFGCLMFYNIIPIVAAVMQVFVQGLNLQSIADVLSVLILFLEIQTYSARTLTLRSEQLVRSQEELSESRIKAMVSQIQPHFLFNALDSIYLLCEEDPARAQYAIDMFSTYLRNNLASLRRSTPVPIETELAHVRTYLELEKVSMEDLLDWEIDAPATGFSVPALSVQTLAENAVRHGVGKKPGGGTIVVRTRETQDGWVVLVIDNGVGFDTSAPIDEGHVGLENTRQRLEALCEGTLQVTSKPGVGTTALIRIPKEMSS